MYYGQRNIVWFWFCFYLLVCLVVVNNSLENTVNAQNIPEYSVTRLCALLCHNVWNDIGNCLAALSILCD